MGPFNLINQLCTAFVLVELEFADGTQDYTLFSTQLQHSPFSWRLFLRYCLLCTILKRVFSISYYFPLFKSLLKRTTMNLHSIYNKYYKFSHFNKEIQVLISNSQMSSTWIIFLVRALKENSCIDYYSCTFFLFPQNFKEFSN